MKTQAEIIARIKEVEASGEDFFGAMRNDLLQFLTFENAKEFLKEDATEEAWNEIRTKAGISGEGDDSMVIKEMLDYLPFAWDKANNCRGLSAGRSIDHMKAYLWLLGDNELLDYAENSYCLYGKNVLKKISEKYNFPWKDHHDGQAGNDESSLKPNDLSMY